MGCLVFLCFQMLSTHLKYPLPWWLPHSSQRGCRLRGTMERKLLPGWLSFPVQSQALTTYSENNSYSKLQIYNQFYLCVLCSKKKQKTKQKCLRPAAIIRVPHVFPVRALGSAGTHLGGLYCLGASTEQHHRWEQQA